MAKRIVIGVSGGIAAFKVAAVVSRLVQSGHEVAVAMSPSSTQFVGPATFSALCSSPPVVDIFDSRYSLGAHIELVDGADLLVYAPATAHLLAACATGSASGLLTTMYLHAECPVLMAPAMSAPMWSKPAVQRNVKQLVEDGVNFVGPEEGWLSCRRVGTGRMSEPESILATCERLLAL